MDGGESTKIYAPVKLLATKQKAVVNAAGPGFKTVFDEGFKIKITFMVFLNQRYTIFDPTCSR